jgi:hypothetical protein
MKLSEIKGEQALDVLADLIEPASEIMTDKMVVAFARGGNSVKAVKCAIKNHKKAVIEILATLDSKDAENYDVNVLTLPAKLLEIFNDPDLMSLFTSRVENTEKTSSTPATEITEEENQ